MVATTKAVIGIQIPSRLEYLKTKKRTIKKKNAKEPSWYNSALTVRFILYVFIVSANSTKKIIKYKFNFIP